MKSRKTCTVLALAACIVTIGLGLSACDSSTATDTDTGAASAALTVDVSSVRRQPVTTTVAATGSVKPWQEVVVSSETSGVALVEVDAAEGDTVRAGQVLARLDDRLLKAQIAEQQAKVSETEASVEKATAANARAEISLADEILPGVPATNVKVTKGASKRSP